MPTGMSRGCGLLIAGPIRPISVTSTSSPTTTGWTYISASALEFLTRRILRLVNSSCQGKHCVDDRGQVERLGQSALEGTDSPATGSAVIQSGRSKERELLPGHSQHTARWGACGKTRVV